jgi:hypothetical protein
MESAAEVARPVALLTMLEATLLGRKLGIDAALALGSSRLLTALMALGTTPPMLEGMMPLGSEIGSRMRLLTTPETEAGMLEGRATIPVATLTTLERTLLTALDGMAMGSPPGLTMGDGEALGHWKMVSVTGAATPPPKGAIGEAPERRGVLPITAKETTKDNIVRMVVEVVASS